MKKASIFVAALLLATAGVQAQEQETTTYGPQAGSFGVELNFTPFGNSVFSTQGIKVRYFFNERMAIRGTIDFTASPRTDLSYSVINQGTADEREVEYKSKSSTGSFAIAPGFEYHFASFKRGSAYAGAEVGFGVQTASYKLTNDYNDASTTIKGANYDVTGSGATGNRASTSFGAGLFTGVDFYVFKNLYVGAELGLRFTTTTEGKVTVKTTDNLGDTLLEETIDDHARSSSFGFFCEPSFRLGWTF